MPVTPRRVGRFAFAGSTAFVEAEAGRLGLDALAVDALRRASLLNQVAAHVTAAQQTHDPAAVPDILGQAERVVTMITAELAAARAMVGAAAAAARDAGVEFPEDARARAKVKADKAKAEK